MSERAQINLITVLVFVALGLFFLALWTIAGGLNDGERSDCNRPTWPCEFVRR